MSDAELLTPDEETQTKLLEQVGEKLADRDWRMDNLYAIRGEEGRVIPFKRNDAQREFDRRMWYRNIIPKARKLGFSTFIDVMMCDECVFNSGTVAGITDKTLDDAEGKLEIVRVAYESMPEEIRDAVPLIRKNDRYLEWSNGSRVSVGLTYRGDTPRILHVSELGKVAVDSPEQAKEINTGAIQAVPQGGLIFVESTAHGTSGLFCDMVQRAEALRATAAPLTRLDFKSHFFAWWHKAEYQVPNHLVIIKDEMRAYYAELELKHGIKLNADQQAWYQKKHDELGPDDVRQEFPSVPEELFYSSLQGAYWRKEMNKARAEGRVGGLVPHDPSRPVNTFWDIGEDRTVVICHQTDGVRHRVIDYFEEEGGSIQSACAWLDGKRQERGFVYGEHYFPHDLDRREWVANATNRMTVATGLLGKKPIIVPRIDDKADSIEAGRRMLNMTWVDQKFASRFVEVCENYRKKWNDRMGHFMAEPVHDWASHGADAWQQGGMGLKPETSKTRGNRHKLSDGRPKSTSWSA